MLVTATFTHEILPQKGIRILSLKTQLYPFEATIQGATVSITPIIDEKSQAEPVYDSDANEIGERPYRYHALHSLQVVVRREVKSVDPKLFDRSLFEGPAMVALRATLRQLREVTGIAEIDVHAARVLAEYQDEDGRLLPWWLANSLVFDGSIVSLDGDDWRDVAANVGKGVETPLTYELVMEARRFLQHNNYAMAALNAAIACEILQNRLAQAVLMNNLGLNAKEARQMTKELKTANLMVLVDRHYDLPPDELIPSYEDMPAITLIRNTADVRNMIAHGDEGVTFSEEQARQAIEAANRLASARPKRTDGDGGVVESVQRS